MNLPKAKEILELNIKEGRKTMPLDVAQAVGLGIEAIKRLQLARSYGDKHCLQRLIGED